MIKAKDGTEVPTDTPAERAALIGGLVRYDTFSPEYGLINSIASDKHAFIRFSWGTTAARTELSMLTLLVPPPSFFEQREEEDHELDDRPAD